MQYKKVQAIFDYARKKAASDSSNANNEDTDNDMPQIVRDIYQYFDINYTSATDDVPETLTLTPCNDDNVSLVIQAGNKRIEVYFNGQQIDIVTSWADDFNAYQAAGVTGDVTV